MRLKREEQSDVALALRYMLNKIFSGATIKVQVSARNGTTGEYTAKEELERLIIQENERKYHQTEGSIDLLRRDFINKLGSFGDGPEVDDVLKGTF